MDGGEELGEERRVAAAPEPAILHLCPATSVGQMVVRLPAMLIHARRRS